MLFFQRIRCVFVIFSVTSLLRCYRLERVYGGFAFILLFGRMLVGASGHSLSHGRRCGKKAWSEGSITTVNKQLYVWISEWLASSVDG